jgi:hypothetical protein
MMRIRPACARRPEAAIAIDLRKSMACSNTKSKKRAAKYASASAERGLEEIEAAGVERGRRLIIHLVRRHLDHLVFQVDGIAGRADLVTAAGRAKLRTAVTGKSGEMAAVGLRHAERRVLSQHRPFDIRRHEVARPNFRHVGIGDIVGQDLLAFLVPLHPGAQHRKERDVVDRHGGLA